MSLTSKDGEITIRQPQALGAGHRPSQKRSLPGIVPACVCSGPGRCSAANPDRPVISREVRDSIRKMCQESPAWGAPRIHGELLRLGIDIGESSVSKYMVCCRKPPSQTCRTFLENHAKQLVSIDFFTVPIIRFHVLYGFWCWPMTGAAFCTQCDRLSDRGVDGTATGRARPRSSTHSWKSVLGMGPRSACA